MVNAAGILEGHAYTLLPSLRAMLRPPTASGEPFTAIASDAQLGAVKLSGVLDEVGESETLILIVHGLGGNAAAAYCIRAAHAARAAGFSSLRLNLRGCDNSGEDFFNGGQIEDLTAALASPRLTRYSRVLLFGYSMGGHIALRTAVLANDKRIKACAAICSPLDLESSSTAIDAPSRTFYRRFVLAGMNEAYAAVAARRPVPTPLAEVRRIRTLRERDAATVVPRYGFRDLADYYARASVAPLLRKLDLPSLFIGSHHDPMVPREVIQDVLADAAGHPGSALTVRWWPRGGHVYLPSDLDLGLVAPKGLEPQVLKWLVHNARS